MAPDRFGYLLGLTSDAFTQFIERVGSRASGRSAWSSPAAWTPA